MRRKKIFGLAAALALAGTLTVGAQTSSTVVEGTPNSFIRVMNVGSAPATMQMDYYHVSNTSLNQNKVIENVPVYTGGAFAPMNVPGFPTGWNGSGVAAADQQIAATSIIRFSGGSYNNDGLGSAAFSGEGAPSTSYFLPLVARDLPANAYSKITVQNAGSGSQNVTIKFFDRNNTEITAAQKDFSLGANLQRTISLEEDANLPTNFVGSAVVTSNGPVAAIVAQYQQRDPEAYNGLPSGGDVLYYSRVVRNISSGGLCIAYSGVVAQNIEATTAEIHVQWFDRDGVLVTEYDDTIAPSTSKGYNTCFTNSGPFDKAALGTNFLGSVKIVSTNGVDIVGINRNWNVNSNFQASFNAANLGSDSVAFPYFYRKTSNGAANGTWVNETGVVVQAVGATAADIVVEFYDLNGNMVYDFIDTVPANSSHGYNSRYMSFTDWPDAAAANTALGYDFDGTVIVRSTNGVDIVGVGFVVNGGGPGGSSEFNAFNN